MSKRDPKASCLTGAGNGCHRRLNARAAILALIAALALSGCVRYRPQPIAADQNLVQLQQRSLSDEDFHGYVEINLQRYFEVWPPKVWDLESLTLAAIYFNPDLASARARYATVAASRLSAAERPNPTLNISPAYNTTTTVPSPWLVTASVDVPIETAGKRGYRINQAVHFADSARLAIATAAWDVRVRLRRTLLEMWAAQETETLLQESQAARQAMVALLEKEEAAGAVSPVEVTRERMLLSQTQLAVLDAESRRAQARSQLAMVVGVPERALENAEISFNFFRQPLPDLPATEVRRRALLNREDVLGALSEYAAAESTLQLEIAKQYPDVHLSPGYEFDQGDNKWGLGLTVDLPILSRNRGRIAEAEAQRSEAAVKFNAVQARVLGEIETALAACSNARKKVAVADALLASSKKQQHFVAKSYEAGEVGLQRVAAARLETTSAALAQFEINWKAQAAMGTLEGALHTPLELPASLFTPVPQRP